jgi:serine/threonine-protein kinase
MRQGSRFLGFWVFSSHMNGAQPNSPMLKLLSELVTNAGMGMDLASSLATTRDFISERARAPHVSGWFSEQSTRQVDPNVGPGVEADALRSMGPFELREKLGSGSFGTVWSAVHRKTEFIVALKMLHPHLRDDPELFNRFLDELAVMTAIDDPNVVRVFDFGNEEGTPWFAMELVRGESLRVRLSRPGALKVDETLTIGEQVASGLAACHRAGVIHRDLSPGNILLARHRVYLVDFGLAHRKGSMLGLQARESSGLAGTPLYMSPEHIDGADLYPGSDLFALGSILYECFSGSAPFKGVTYSDTLLQIQAGRFRPLAEHCPGLSNEVVGVVESLLEVGRERRPADARRVARQLRNLRRKALAVPGQRSLISS